MAKEITTNEEFKIEYAKCKTYGDWDRLIKRTNIKLKIRIYKALCLVLETTGATIREESFAIALGHFVKGLNEEDFS